jgi:MFS family permease
MTDECAGRIRQPLAVAMGVMGAWMLVMPASTVTLALSVSHAGGSTRDYSVGLSLGWLTLTVMSISFAALSDRIRARQPRRIGALILVALTACLAVSLVLDAGTSPGVIVVAWIILQIPASAILGAAMSQAAAVADPRRRGIVSGLVGSAALLALMVGAPLALAAGPRLSFTAAAIGGSVLLVPLLRLVSRQVPTPVLTAPTGAVRAHPRPGGPWLVLLGIGFFVSVATAITNSYVVAITSSVLSMGGREVSAESLATLAIVIASLLAVVASIASGAFLPTARRTSTAWVAALILLVASLVLIVAIPSVTTLLIGVAGFGLAFGVINSGELTLALNARPEIEHGGRTVAMFTAATTVPYILVPAMVALLPAAESRPLTMLSSAAVAGVIGLGLALILQKLVARP